MASICEITAWSMDKMSYLIYGVAESKLSKPMS